MRSTPTREVLVDTCVLVHAHNEDSPLHDAARSLCEAVSGGRVRACLTHQNLLEFYSVVTGKGRVEHPIVPAKARDQVRLYLSDPFFRMIAPTDETPSILLDLLGRVRVSGAYVFDMWLAATMLTHGVTAIATFNAADFSPIPGIEVFVPGE